MRDYLSWLMVATLTGCMTPREKKDLQNDLFNVQTRLLTLERQLSDTSKDARSTGETATKRLATTQADLDKLLRDMQQVRGDIDALKVGVMTGQMPGQQGNDASVAATLTRISERLEAVEQTQGEIIDALKKAGLNRSKKPNRQLSSVSDLEQAFGEKQYKLVADEGSRLIGQANGDDAHQTRLLVAESYFKLGKIREAALKFNELIEGNPPAKHLPLAKMRLGDCFRQMGDTATAKIYYEELIREFPNSDEAAKAKERLVNGGKTAADAEKG